MQLCKVEDVFKSSRWLKMATMIGVLKPWMDDSVKCFIQTYIHLIVDISFKTIGYFMAISSMTNDNVFHFLFYNRNVELWP